MITTNRMRGNDAHVHSHLHSYVVVYTCLKVGHHYMCANKVRKQKRIKELLSGEIQKSMQTTGYLSGRQLTMWWWWWWRPFHSSYERNLVLKLWSACLLILLPLLLPRWQLWEKQRSANNITRLLTTYKATAERHHQHHPHQRDHRPGWTTKKQEIVMIALTPIHPSRCKVNQPTNQPTNEATSEKCI